MLKLYMWDVLTNKRAIGLQLRRFWLNTTLLSNSITKPIGASIPQQSRRYFPFSCPSPFITLLSPSSSLSSPAIPSRPPPSPPAAKRSLETSWRVWRRCKLPSGVWAYSPSRHRFGVFWEAKPEDANVKRSKMFSATVSVGDVSRPLSYSYMTQFSTRAFGLLYTDYVQCM